MAKRPNYRQGIIAGVVLLVVLTASQVATSADKWAAVGSALLIGVPLVAIALGVIALIHRSQVKFGGERGDGAP